MNQESSDSKQIVQGITLLCFLLPLTFFPGLVSLYRLPKLTFFAFFTCVLCWLWLLNWIRLKDNHIPAFPLFIPLLFYLLVSAFSLYSAINPYEGFFSLSQLILGISLFWITANHIEAKKISTLFHWIAISGAIVSILGIAQAWGVNIPGLIPIESPGSTFGNRNMAAQYLLFVIPAGFYLVFSSSEPTREWLYALLTAFISTYFIYTGTRAAWGAATIAFIILWFCLRARGFTPQELLSFSKRKWAFLIGITVFVAALNVIPPYFIPNFGAPPTLTRLQSMLEIETDTSAQTRFAIWANTLAIFFDHPLLGVGKGNFQFSYPLYARRVMRDPSFSAEVTAKETHNDYVQLLAETGVVGFGAFLWILILLGRRFWLVVNGPMAVVGYSLTAILLEAFWDFPFRLPVPTAFFWIFAGCLWSCSKLDVSLPLIKPISAKVAIGVLTVIVTFFSVWGLSSLRGEFYYSRGAFALYDGRLPEAKEALTKATEINPLNYRYQFLRGLLMIRMEDYPAALHSTLKSLWLNPYHINALNNLGVAYASLGNISKAVQAFETSIRIWPYHIEAHNNLGTIYGRLGNKDKALHHFETVLRLSPQDPKALEAVRILNETPPQGPAKKR